MTDSEIIAAFAELLNRWDGVFVRGQVVACDEDIQKIWLGKLIGAELICDDEGKLVELNEMEF